MAWQLVDSIWKATEWSSVLLNCFGAPVTQSRVKGAIFEKIRCDAEDATISWHPRMNFDVVWFIFMISLVWIDSVWLQVGAGHRMLSSGLEGRNLSLSARSCYHGTRDATPLDMHASLNHWTGLQVRSRLKIESKEKYWMAVKGVYLLERNAVAVQNSDFVLKKV